MIHWFFEVAGAFFSYIESAIDGGCQTITEVQVVATKTILWLF
jgi:hypothetical protein